MPYGVANASGMPKAGEVRAIIETAFDAGIRRLDTARGYGRSEQAIGQALRELGLTGEARLTTKLGREVDVRDARAVLDAVEGAAERLGCVPEAVLLHDESNLDDWDRGVGQALSAVVEAGLAGAVGVSVYAPERALAALDLPGLTRLQCPANVLDSRFAKAGVFDKASARGVEVSIRSVFLQGLLLLHPDELPACLVFAAPFVRRFGELAAALDLAPSAAALSYALAAYPESPVVIGVELKRQLDRNIADAARTLPPDALAALHKAFDTVPETVINPCLWPAA